MNQRNIRPIIATAFLAFSLTAGATTARRLNPDAVEVSLSKDSPTLVVDFYGPNIFRLFQDPKGGIVRNPEANPPAQILVDNPRVATGDVKVENNSDGSVCISTPRIKIDFSPSGDSFSVTDLSSGKKVTESISAPDFQKNKTILKFTENGDEYFYGGGVQNGRFSHKGKKIDIVNTNSWTDGGVASPTPFYWSTNGYGLMWHTFAPGEYDFGLSTPGEVTVTHQTPYLDVFMMVDEKPETLLKDFYQLTGKPVLLPKFGFYEGHLNAYNRDYWKETEPGSRTVLFEDGKHYTESQKDNGGIKESLNGELPGNYQFSARAVIDRYNAHDMPLGWVLPNDGYGAGYGQTGTLDGNIRNLKEYGDYARKHGVEIGLWTQSDLHPKEGVEALLQRDIVKEVRDAGVRVLKTDVAWVGDGYSFGLNGVADVGKIMPYYGNNARPFIISLDGWAGTQRYAGVWSGDQTGGQWEYIRFHIPTYIGSGLSGQPNISSDMDGIFGGKNVPVNIRDFQWKTFTPMQLNMDGWGSNPKYPHVLGEPAESINRAYLKLKSELLPYAYTYAREAVDGKPLMRAMFIDYSNDFTKGIATRYQFLYGPDILVAPIYQATASDTLGNDIRHNIYLPEGRWFDYFTGNAYTSDGSVVLNNFDSPIWKLPVFVKGGAIIPMVNPNNNPSQINRGQRIFELWPEGRSEMSLYDDDGTTEAYINGEYATTHIVSDMTTNRNLSVTIEPTTGDFSGMEKNQSTILRINCSALPKQVSATVNGKKINLTKLAATDFETSQSGWTYVESTDRLSKWGVKGTTNGNPQIWVKLPSVNIASATLNVTVKGFELNPSVISYGIDMPSLAEMAKPIFTEPVVNPYDITLNWQTNADADYLEIFHDGILYTNLGASEGNNSYTMADLKPATTYTFKLRKVKDGTVSDWTETTLTTADNPLEHAIHGVSATCTASAQPGFYESRLFNFKESGDTWHTRYSKRDATPFDMIIDLGTFNTLSHFNYLPRVDAGNGTLLEGTVSFSENGKEWSEPVSFKWERNGDTKSFDFPSHPLARFIRLHVDKSVGGFGSGRELYVFRMPGTPSFIPGDINNDGKIDENDLTSYMNYTGLKKGDGDFDYVSMGDINRNGVIDAFDISNVAVRLNDGVEIPEQGLDSIAGTLLWKVADRTYRAGEEVVITVEGKDLRSLNAWGCAVPYDPSKLEYLGIEPFDACKKMDNLTYDRLHTNGTKVLYPTFVNLGTDPDINGNEPLAKILFRAKSVVKAPKAVDFIIVDKLLRTIEVSK